jgi:hypothetical protein
MLADLFQKHVLGLLSFLNGKITVESVSNMTKSLPYVFSGLVKLFILGIDKLLCEMVLWMHSLDAAQRTKRGA